MNSTKGDNTPTNTLGDRQLREKVIDAVCYKPHIEGHLEQFRRIEALISEAVNKAELACAVYMEPGRFQDYKNRRDGTFQNDPRLNRDETPNQVEGK